MPWSEATKYSAIIGGCYFQNIPQIIQHDGDPLLTIKTDTDNGKIGIDTKIMDAAQKIIAVIENGTVKLKNQSKYHLVEVENRSSIVEKETGKILYDFKKLDGKDGLDFTLSMMTYIGHNLPVFLHPNRIRIGSANILKPHMTSLKLTTKEGSLGPALKISICQPEEGNKECGYMPRAPMTGKGGVVTNFLSDKTDTSKSEMATLILGGKNKQAANIAFQGPCYFLDVAIENFATALQVSSEISKS